MIGARCRGPSCAYLCLRRAAEQYAFSFGFRTGERGRPAPLKSVIAPKFIICQFALDPAPFRPHVDVLFIGFRFSFPRVGWAKDSEVVHVVGNPEK